MKTLNQITQDLIVSQHSLELTQGEIDAHLECELIELGKELGIKSDHYVYRIQKLESMVYFWNLKAQEAKAIALSINSHIENMKDRIKETMQVLNKSVIEGEVHRLTIRPTPKPRLIIDGPVDPTYEMQVVTQVPDKERIKEDLLSGKEVMGAHLEQGMTLRIDYKK